MDTEETTDAKRNIVVNVLVPTINLNSPLLPYVLLCSKCLPRTNVEAIVQVIKDAIEVFGTQENLVTMLANDAKIGADS